MSRLLHFAITSHRSHQLSKCKMLVLHRGIALHVNDGTADNLSTGSQASAASSPAYPPRLGRPRSKPLSVGVSRSSTRPATEAPSFAEQRRHGRHVRLVVAQRALERASGGFWLGRRRAAPLRPVSLDERSRTFNERTHQKGETLQYGGR